MKKITPYLLIVIGCILSAFGYSSFILPLKLMEGGVTGIGMIVKELTGLPIVGTTAIILTIGFFVAAMKLLGRAFGFKSFFAMILSNILIDVFEWCKIPAFTNDTMLAAFYGAAFVGIGLGFIYYTGAATGGADALAQILLRIRGVPMGRTLLVADFIVLGAGLFIFGAEKIMYSFLFIFIEIKVIDLVLNGIKASQKLIIVTEKPQEIAKGVMQKLSRGVTLFDAYGGYTGNKKLAVLTVVPRRNLPEARRIISEIDDKAFVIIQDVYQVYGEGYEPLPIN